MFLWVLFLHNYIIPQKGCIIAFFGMQPFLLFFYSAFGAGLVGNYMKMNGVVFMEQNLGSVSVILSISAVGEFMMWHL